MLHLELRWLLDQPGLSVALWGAKRLEQLAPAREAVDWRLKPEDMQAIESILAEAVQDPVGPEYLCPGVRD